MTDVQTAHLEPGGGRGRDSACRLPSSRGGRDQMSHLLSGEITNYFAAKVLFVDLGGISL